MERAECAGTPAELANSDATYDLAFDQQSYRDSLGFEVRSDVGNGKMRWMTVGPADQPGTSILLAAPAADPGTTDDERGTIAEMMATGTYGWILLATKDLDGTFEKLRPATPTSSRSRPSSHTAFATVPSAIPWAT